MSTDKIKLWKGLCLHKYQKSQSHKTPTHITIKFRVSISYIDQIFKKLQSKIKNGGVDCSTEGFGSESDDKIRLPKSTGVQETRVKNLKAWRE